MTAGSSISLVSAMNDTQSDTPAVPGVTRLGARDMPESRRKLSHVQIRYEDAEDEGGEDAEKEKVAIVSSDPISEEEKSQLVYGEMPAPRSKVLIHSCCAPCSGAMVEEMLEKNLDMTIFFYNPNIHPKKEYEIRKEENIRYAKKHSIPIVDCDYDADSWFERMVGFELEPERGVRCSACFDMRMEVTAAYAVEHGFEYFTTTNATSRWKDETQVNLAGIRAAALYNGAEGEEKKVKFWVYNWQTPEFTRRKYEVSVGEKFYKQEYCGCGYSLRDSNIWRAQQGIPPVKIGGEAAGLGTRYFENVEADEEEESQEVVDSFFADAENHFGNEKRIVQQMTKVQSVLQGRLKSSGSVADNNW